MTDPPGPGWWQPLRRRGQPWPWPRTGNPLAVTDTRVGLPLAATRRGGRRGGGRPALRWGWGGGGGVEKNQEGKTEQYSPESPSQFFSFLILLLWGWHKASYSFWEEFIPQYISGKQFYHECSHCTIQLPSYLQEGILYTKAGDPVLSTSTAIWTGLGCFYSR